MVSAFSGYKTALSDPNLVALTAMAEIAHAPLLGLLVSFGAVISLFACSLACVTATSRILLSMSRDGLLHASIWASRTTPMRHRTSPPTVSAIIMLVVLVGLSLKGYVAAGHLQHERDHRHLRLPAGLCPDRRRLRRLGAARQDSLRPG